MTIKRDGAGFYSILGTENGQPIVVELYKLDTRSNAWQANIDGENLGSEWATKKEAVQAIATMLD